MCFRDFGVSMISFSSMHSLGSIIFRSSLRLIELNFSVLMEYRNYGKVRSNQK